MKKFNLLFTLLFTFIFYTNLQAQDKFIDIIHEKGILFQKDADTAFIDFHPHGNDSSYLILCPYKEDGLANNVIITQDGQMTIGTLDPCDDLGKLDTIVFDDTYKLILSDGEALKEGSADWSIFSDQRLKTNIEPYQKGLTTLKKLNFYEFEYNGLANTTVGKKHVGVMAQEIREVLPNTVDIVPQRLRRESTELTDIHIFNPDELRYLTINSVKELSEKTEELEVLTVQQAQELSQKMEELETLQQQYDGLANDLAQIKALLGLANQATPIDPNPTLERSGYLLQNVPNPVTAVTRLPYFVPTETKNASILVYNIEGTLVEKFAVQEQGHGTITWNTQHLPQGIYTYILWMDEQQIDVKKMVLK